MSLTLETTMEPHAIVVRVKGDSTPVGHVVYRPADQDEGRPASTWLAESFANDERREFLSRQAAEYWIFALELEHQAANEL